MHVIRSRNNQILIDELDLVRVFGLLYTSIFHCLLVLRESRTFALDIVIASPLWITYMYGMALAQFLPNVLQHWIMERGWPPQVQWS